LRDRALYLLIVGGLARASVFPLCTILALVFLTFFYLFFKKILFIQSRIIGCTISARVWRTGDEGINTHSHTQDVFGIQTNLPGYLAGYLHTADNKKRGNVLIATIGCLRIYVIRIVV
jgi:hypothetical protein